MDQAELMTKIKTNARSVVDAVNRAVEQADVRVKKMGPSLGTEDLTIMNSVLEMLRDAAADLERGVSLLGESGTKVA